MLRRKNLLILLVSLVFLAILIPTVCATDNETILLSDDSLNMAPVSISNNGGDILKVSDDYYFDESVENEDNCNRLNENKLTVFEDEVASEPAKEESNATVIVPNGVKAGESANISVNIVNAIGNVSVLVDGNENNVALVNGNAVVHLDNLTAGNHSVVVIYGGDETHAPSHSISSFSVADKVVVKPVMTEFVNITVFRDSNVSAILVDERGNPVANAAITYAVGDKSQSVVSDSNGGFVIKGESGVLMTVVYGGDDNYLATNTTIQFDNAAHASIQSTRISGNDFSQYACDYYEGERGGNFIFQLVDGEGNPVANKNIYIGYNGVTLTRVTDEKGFASVQINLKSSGVYTFVIVFLGDKDYNASMAVHKVTINKKPISMSASAKTFKATAKSKKYTVTLKTIKGSSIDGKTYLAAGKKITLTLNGKTYTTKTNANGQATFSLKLTKKGKFNAEIVYDGDSTYKAASKKVKITIK